MLVEAERHQRRARQLAPAEPSYAFYLGNTLSKLAGLDHSQQPQPNCTAAAARARAGAIEQFEDALRLHPALAIAHYNMVSQLLDAPACWATVPRRSAEAGGGGGDGGTAAAQALGRAERHLLAVAKLEPRSPKPFAALGAALRRGGSRARVAEATQHFRRALELVEVGGPVAAAAFRAEAFAARVGIGHVLLQQGHQLAALRESRTHFRAALRAGGGMAPDEERARGGLATVDFALAQAALRHSHRDCGQAPGAAHSVGDEAAAAGEAAEGAIAPSAIRRMAGTEGTADASALIVDALPAREAAALIEAAERHAASVGGWDMHLHTYTHGDLLAKDVPGVGHIVRRLLARLLETVRREYLCGGGACPCDGVDVAFSTVDEPWITRYDAEMNPNARLHFDTRSNITVNVMLSDPADYSGGGTFLHASGSSVRLQQGQALIHPGHLVHKSIAVTGGRRHILVGFTTLSNHTLQDTEHQTATFA